MLNKSWIIIILVVSTFLMFITQIIGSPVMLVGIISSVLLFIIFCVQKIIEKKNKSEKSIIELLPMPIIVVVNDKIDYVNRAGLSMFEATAAQLNGKLVTNYIVFNGGGKEPVDESQSRLGKLTDVRGNTVDVELLQKPLSNHQREEYFLLVRDISEQKENQSKLQHFEQLSLLGELAAGIAHEIRNPITSLKGFLQLIDSTEAKSTPYTKIMLSEIERINLIVSELLFLGKPKELSIKKHNLFEIIEMVVTLTKTQAIIYNIDIKLQMETALKKEMVKCDESKLKQVFINILRNAIEAMKHEGIITINVSRKHDFIEIAIIDQGKGIPKKKLANIGKQFYTTKENGTGLGLMISNHIIEEHGGSLSLESEEGKGTTVQISLPTCSRIKAVQ
ncbi:ATP-binding protein [Halalkalibacter alkaliphilus]|uniref:histidine kinase n=1 Tax=Halalkalibacter alkaliphilus TaxID=2917993 RepID=A0A9X2CT24_9BACI|nr:ATP-binding protein [Halalkalibacter alkaliphilus]MCL7747723.1 ATP-binding protein [Halalkalibacter alkaliphilus]